MKDRRQPIEDELPAFIAGRAGADLAGDVQAWAEDRPERSQFLADWKLIARGLREGGAAFALTCPDASTLVQWARGQRTDPTGHIPRHLETCASCSIEVEVAQRNRRAQAAPVAPVTKKFAIYRFASFAAAAGIALGLGLGVALDRLVPGSDPVPHGGAADLLEIVPSLRGGNESIRYRLSEGQLFVPLALSPELPGEGSPADLYQLAILEAGGGEVWSQELTAAAIQSRLAASGVLLLLVPAQVLPPGSYVMRVAPAEGQARPVLEVPFGVD